MIKFFSNHQILTFLLVILILSFPTFFNLFHQGFFYMQDNVSVMRLLEMNKCFANLQIPCRWAPDMGAGYGHPLFNYHPPLVYYVGIFLTIFLSYITTVKVLLFLGLILSGIFMFFLVREFFGNLAGLTGAIFFIYAPYHSVDLYVRGDIAEEWGIMFFPLILWSLYKFISSGKLKWFLLSILSISLLFLTHNIMSVLFEPVAIVWISVFSIKYKFKRILHLAVIFIWSVGLSAFFIFPSIFELPYINVLQKSGYYDFHNHFVTLFDLFLNRSFNFGGSGFGSVDHLSFQIGWPYWALSFIFGIWSIYLFLRKGKLGFGILSLAFLVFLVSIFMTHSKSVFIWEKLSTILSFVQFPWRFLGLVIFASSFLIGGSISFFKGKLKIAASLGLIALTILLNFNYFHPKYFLPFATDQNLLSGQNFTSQSMSTLLDYIPVTDKQRVLQMAPKGPIVENGSAIISDFNKYSNKFDFNIVVNTSSALVKVPIFYFPNWNLFLNGKRTEISYNNGFGLIEVMVPQGSYKIVGKLENTPLRTLVNFISLFSVLGLLILTILWLKNSFKINLGKNIKNGEI